MADKARSVTDDAAVALKRCFAPASNAALWDDFIGRFRDSGQRIAWYPSSGSDWGPLLYFKELTSRHLKVKLPSNYSEPNLWVFSDAKAWDDGSAPPFPILYEDFQTKRQRAEALLPLHRPIPVRTRITVLEKCEITPVPDAYRVSEGWNGRPDFRCAFYLRIRVNCHIAGEYEADALTFSCLNQGLLSQFFINQNIKTLTHLYWMCDGWTSGMGGENGSGNFRFLLPLSRRLGTQWYLMDPDYTRLNEPRPWPLPLKADWDADVALEPLGSIHVSGGGGSTCTFFQRK